MVKTLVETNKENLTKYQKIITKYKQYVDKVKIDTQYSSKLGDILKHNKFRKLVVEGPRIVNWLFYDMLHHGTSWTHILLLHEIFTSISKQRPADTNGDLLRIYIFWLQWYANSNYRKNKDIYMGLIK